MKAMFRNSMVLIIAAGFLFFVGCAGRHTIKLDTNPTGAKVVLDGKSQSDTPSLISVKKDGNAHYLFVKKTGCKELRKILRNNKYPNKLLLNLDCGSLAAEDAARLAAEKAKRRAIEKQKALEEERLRALEQNEMGSEGDMSDPRSRFLNEDVFFDYNSAFITAAAREVLHAKAEWLRDNSHVTVILQGHTDERGTVVYNLALGDRRAQSAFAFLVDLGIAGNRLRTVSYGEEFPINSGHGADAWAENRRVHFVIEAE